MISTIFTLLDFPPHGDVERGFLASVDPAPFPIRRVFWIYNWPAGVRRGGHAHRECQQLFILVEGRVDFTLRNAHGMVTQTMSVPHQGLWVPPMVWVEMEAMALDNILLCLCSTEYNEADYIRNADEWRKLVTVRDA